MTTIPTYEEVNKEDNSRESQGCETIEPLDIPPQTEDVKDLESNEAKNIYDLCPPSIKREIMTRLTKKKILLYDPDMLSSEALEVIVRVKEAYDRKKQRSCNDLKNKRLAKQTTIEPDGGAVDAQGRGEVQAEEAAEEPEEKYEPAEVLQPAKILEPVKQVRKLRKNVVKKEVPPPIEPQTPRASPPQNLQPVKVGLFKSEICGNREATIPRVSTKLFM